MSLTTIGQRELRNDNAEIMRRVEAGESFVVTRNNKPVAQLSPYRVDVMWHEQRPVRLDEVQEAFRQLPPVDADRWEADRRAADEVFGEDDPVADPWQS
ncbi:type II toxin-antitoxin system Phd/YefM family antitoxin [Nocardia sp. NRRL S-836]|uniref:type II toxin-antitoxin system Phd/YefM family antitoxin n=1 Tax=Nocardia sp. NRRL S-836 TaxID=1519492 RepID=UPI0006B05546|nr:type II toxin-antitoxin system prevent-host-death family antitoxin [Nocardia sp. NRRL S-836]KOV79018.1 prevent-host-death protein [Nocardia sp. NRRL S-836]